MLVYLEIVAFLLFVNFMPALAREILGKRFTYPLDRGIIWFDNRFIFGPHKTIRGVLASLLGGSFFFVIWPFDLITTITASVLVSTGDLLTSFLKRRFRYKTGKVVPIADQFLEGLLPVAFLASRPGIDHFYALLALLLFIPISYAGSLIWNYLIYKTSPTNSPRIIRATTRLREWRACHQPLARWQTVLNFEHFFFYKIIIGLFFKITGIYDHGVRNALNIEVEEYNFTMKNLPAEFDGLRVMFMTDLHIDGLPELLPVILEKITDIEVDICILGGDYRMAVYGTIQPALRALSKIVRQVHSEEGVFGILGNHDCIEMIPDLEETGIYMLVNDAWAIERHGQRIWLAGIDDPHFYKTHNLTMTFEKINQGEFCIFLSHSPEVYKEIGPYQPDLFLCGHTHGGQICLPGQYPLFTNCRAPRNVTTGKWKYNSITGFTSRGVGSSGVPVRFNCPPEIAILTLYSDFHGDNN